MMNSLGSQNKTGRHSVVIFTIIYRVLLDIVFVLFVAVRYGYMGFSFSFSLTCLVLSYIVTIFAGYYIGNISQKKTDPDYILVFLIYMYLIPQCTMCAFSLNDLPFFTFVVVYFLLLIILNKFISLPKFRFIGPNQSRYFIWATMMFGMLMIAISGYYTGFRISFRLDDYYEFRMEAREYSIPSVLAYLFQWAKTILPIGTLYALIKKKRLIVVLSSVSQILCFSFNGKKSVLFTFVLVFIIYFFYSERIKDDIPKIFSGLTLLSIIEMIVRHGDSFIGNKFIRRMMIVPSYLGWTYYDYFSKNELDYLRTSILRRVGFISPYTESIPRMIGRIYFASDGSMNANTGLCGDAFSNFGWASLLIYPLLLIILFKFINICIEGLDKRMSLLVSFLVAYMMLSGTFFKCLLTGGLLLIGILMRLIPRDNE